MIEENYENDELENIIERYLSIEIMKYIPRTVEQKNELDTMFKDRVISLKIKGEHDHDHDHSYDEDNICTDGSNQYNDNMSESQYDNR